jgi:hypothetical protein
MSPDVGKPVTPADLRRLQEAKVGALVLLHHCDGAVLTARQTLDRALDEQRDAAEAYARVEEEVRVATMPKLRRAG